MDQEIRRLIKKGRRRNKSDENRLLVLLTEQQTPDYFDRERYEISEMVADRYARHALRRGATVATLTAAQWNAILRHYDFRCVYCGCRPTTRLTVDHRIPLCRGGQHVASNVVPACGSCNSSKGSKLLTEWRRFS